LFFDIESEEESDGVQPRSMRAFAWILH